MQIPLNFFLYEALDGMCSNKMKIDKKKINLFYRSCCIDSQNKPPITSLKLIYKNHTKVDSYVRSNIKT